MTSHVMFQNGPTIRGTLEDVIDATVAFATSKHCIGESAIILGGSPDTAEFLAAFRQRHPWSGGFTAPDFTKFEPATFTTTVCPLDEPVRR